LDNVPRKFGDWGRSGATGYLEWIAAVLGALVALELAGRYWF
jgi:hypothetical protein